MKNYNVRKADKLNVVVENITDEKTAPLGFVSTAHEPAKIKKHVLNILAEDMFLDRVKKLRDDCMRVAERVTRDVKWGDMHDKG